MNSIEKIYNILFNSDIPLHNLHSNYITYLLTTKAMPMKMARKNQSILHYIGKTFYLETINFWFWFFMQIKSFYLCFVIGKDVDIVSSVTHTTYSLLFLHSFWIMYASSCDVETWYYKRFISAFVFCIYSFWTFVLFVLSI